MSLSLGGTPFLRALSSSQKTSFASSLLLRVGAYALMTLTCREGLSGKGSFINRSLTGVRRSGSCLQSEVLMASPTPYILYSSFVFPLQKNVYPPFGSAVKPSSVSLVSLRAVMSIWYLPSSLAMRAVLLTGLEEASWSRRVRTFHAPKIIFLFFFCCCCCC